MAMLGAIVEMVIGVDTHTQAHCGGGRGRRATTTT